MQLTILNGYIFPTALPVTKGFETVDVTDEEHGLILADWNAENPLAYKADGSGAQSLDAELRKSIYDEAEKALSDVKKQLKEAEAEAEARMKKIRKGIGKSR